MAAGAGAAAFVLASPFALIDFSALRADLALGHLEQRADRTGLRRIPRMSEPSAADRFRQDARRATANAPLRAFLREALDHVEEYCEQRGGLVLPEAVEQAN